MPLDKFQILDYTTLTISSTAVSFENATPSIKTVNDVDLFVGTLETDSIRVRNDGTNPTASEGQLIPAGVVVEIDGQDLGDFKAIRVTNDAVLKGHYYKYMGERR